MSTKAISRCSLTIEQVKQLLQPFTGEIGEQYDVALPWVRDGYCYATDGRIAVRISVPADNDDSTRKPKISEIFEKFPKDETFMPIVFDCGKWCPHDDKFQCSVDGVNIGIHYLDLIGQFCCALNDIAIEEDIEYEPLVGTQMKNRVVPFVVGPAEILLMPRDK